MLVYPVYEGSANRFKEPADFTDAIIASRLVTAWRADMGRTIDYLQTRPDVDIQRLGYLGVSLGGTSAVPAMTVESRFKVAVLISGGILPAAVTSSPLTDPVNFAPRIHIPVLMFSGRYDPYLTVEGSQQPLFRLLGSPPADKRYVQAEYAHVSPPRAELLREVLGWYDKYLGKVRQ
jgi:dienelactone hydrolase